MRYGPAERLVALTVELGSSRNGLTIDDVMDRFQISRRTAERLLSAVNDIFAIDQIAAWEDRRKRYRLNRTPTYFLSPTTDELAAIDLAAANLDQQGLASQAENLRKLGAKIRASLDARIGLRMETDLEALAEAEGFAFRPGPRQRIDWDIFETLRFAIKAHRKVRITYRYRGSGSVGYQTVHPYGFLYGVRHYLVAFSENERALDVRFYALPNIQKAKLLDENFVRQEGFSMESLTKSMFGVFREKPVKVVWRFSADVAEDARAYQFHAAQSTKDLDDGRLEVTFTAGGMLEMVWHLFKWGEQVEIVEPNELLTLFQEQIDRVQNSSKA